MQKTIQVNTAKLKKKFLELIQRFEENKIQAIGQFLEEEVLPIMSLKDFAELVKDEAEGYSIRQLEYFRNIYKGLSHHVHKIVGVDMHKLEPISRIADEKVKEEFLDRAKEVGRNQLRAEVNEYLETGKKPSEESKSIIQIQLAYTGAALKLINEMRLLRKALQDFKEHKFMDNLTDNQKTKFTDYLKTIKNEYQLLIKEIENLSLED